LWPTSGKIGTLPPPGMMGLMTQWRSYTAYEIYCELIQTLVYQKVNGILYFMQTNKKNSVALSPWANYTDWATATCWRNLMPTLTIT
jgi:hypothetical protein